MLIRFVVENFLSFKEEATLNMIATKGDQHQHHIVSHKNGKELSLLRVAALYGANASGKSNLVQAIDFVRELIVRGTKSDQSIPVIPFRLSKDAIQKPSKFEFTIKYDGDIYTYGLKLSSKQIIEEWLFGTPKTKSREIRYFERVTSKEGKVKVEFGPILTGNRPKHQQFLRFIAKGTRPNQPFLTEAVDRNVKAVKPLMDWFKNVLQIVPAESTYTSLELTAHKDRSFTKFLGDFLRTAGTGIEGIDTEKLPLDFNKVEDLPDEEKEEIRSNLLKGSNYVVTIEDKQYGVTLGENNQPILVGLKTLHHTTDGQSILFDIEDESEGTQRLIHLLPTLANSKTTEKVYVIDELDRRLHPLLSRMFLEVYLQCDGEPPRGQMIFTTHDTNLLDLELMRRDEVWFIEKDDKGISHLYSLADFKIRQGLKIQKGYLNGRFGAIPFIGDICKLGWTPDMNRQEA